MLATEKAELQRGKQEAERQLAQLQQHMQVGWARGICWAREIFGATQQQCMLVVHTGSGRQRHAMHKCFVDPAPHAGA